MDIRLFEQLHLDGVVTAESLDRIKTHEQNVPVSVHWDLRLLLYISILLLTGGVGIFLYKNIDTIGHAAIVTVTGILAAVCIVYCYRKAAPYSHHEVSNPNMWADYILMLGCLLMLAFVGYLQFQYQFFGDRWGMATFIPMLFLFAFAYRFDHRGVLALAITNLGTWMGVALAPASLLQSGFYDSDNSRIISGIILGVLLHLFCAASRVLQIKVHFVPVYRNFAMHVSFVSLFAAMISFESVWALWFLVLVALAVYYTVQAMTRRSLYYAACAALYTYFAVAYAFIRVVTDGKISSNSVIYVISLYIIASAVGVGGWLVRLNKQFKNHAGIQQESTE